MSIYSEMYKHSLEQLLQSWLLAVKYYIGLYSACSLYCTGKFAFKKCKFKIFYSIQPRNKLTNLTIYIHILESKEITSHMYWRKLTSYIK